MSKGATTMTHDFPLLCGYSMGNFYKDAVVVEICQQHTHLVDADGTSASSTGASGISDGPRQAVRLVLLEL